jgi:hypothetical protein
MKYKNIFPGSATDKLPNTIEELEDLIQSAESKLRQVEKDLVGLKAIVEITICSSPNEDRLVLVRTNDSSGYQFLVPMQSLKVLPNSLRTRNV